MVNFFSIFCQDLQKLLKPIYDLTRKGRPFVWQQEQQTAFEEMKSRLQKPPILHLPDEKGRFHLYSDTRFKLDTRATGNLLPVSVYHALFPDCNMKDLGKIIDKSVQLLIVTKSSIKQFGTVHLIGFHSQCNFLYTCLFSVVPTKCKPILGLPDLM